MPLLHDYWRSSASYRVRIALNLKDIAYEAASIDLLKEQQRSDAHLARNPQGLVPVLEIDDTTLTQSLAIIEYLEETRPQPPLLPQGALGRARVRTIAQAIAMEIHPVCNLATVNRIVALAKGDEETRRSWMQQNIRKGLEAVETLLESPETGRFCHGEHPTMADCCLIPQLYNARRWSAPLQDLTRILAVEAVCAEHPAFAAAHPDRVRPAG